MVKTIGTICNSEQELYEFLVQFLSSNPQAAQLDGSQRKSDEGFPVVYVWIASRNGWYVLTGNTKLEAIKRFIALYGSASDKPSVLKPSRADKPNSSLILSDGQRASGWYCFSADRIPANARPFREKEAA